MKNEIKRTQEILERIDDSLADATLSSPDGAPLGRSVVAALGIFHQVVEHCFAVERLYRDPPFYGSALALLRSIFEGLVRGLWLLHCATPTQATNFIEKDALKFSIENLTQRVEATHIGFSGGNLSQTVKGAWDSMCSYAHTGMRQVERRVAKGEIRSNYTQAELIEVLKTVRIFAIFAAFEIAVLSNRHAVVSQLIEELKTEIA